MEQSKNIFLPVETTIPSAFLTLGGEEAQSNHPKQHGG
jgi:hypothetical protein